MLKKSLTEEFNVNIQSENTIINDYNIFKDKDSLDELRRHILERLGDITGTMGEINKDIIIKTINSETEMSNLNNLERSHLYNIIENEIFGYGPLTELLKDQNISEIMVNAPDEIYISINGQIMPDKSISFINNDHIMRTIKKMIKTTNINLNDNKSITVHLEDGSILNAIFPPISSKGPILTIKKHNKALSTIDDLLKIGSLTPYMARFLNAAVLAKLNIIICGSTSSGKTSLLNALGNLIDPNARVITVENVSELKIKKNNIIHLNPINNEDLITDSLKMFPDTLIIGEIDKTNTMQTMNIMLDNNNINVLTTILSSDVIETINKFETIGYVESNLSSKSMRDKLYNAIDLIINIKELSDHKRKITSICEFNKNKDNEIVLKEIFAYKVKEVLPNGDVTGEYSLFKYMPRSYQKIKQANINSIDDIFNN